MSQLDATLLCLAHGRLPAPPRLPVDVEALLNAPHVPESRFELAPVQAVRCPTILMWAAMGCERATI